MNKKVSTDAFHLSTEYYDLLYSDKDYEREAEFIADLIKHYCPAAKEIIELGSGTGNYSQHLCNKGFAITGIEQSGLMSAIANEKSIPSFSSVVADISDFNLNRQFDAAISLFHVISYLTHNDKILSCFRQVSKHLKPKAIFVFDVWYTPAVYSQMPEYRVKQIENESYEITRHAEPVVAFEKNVIQVNYEICVKNKENEEFDLFKESHLMRHFGTPEIELFASLSGFTLLKSEELLTAEKPSNKTWGVCFILQKND